MPLIEPEPIKTEKINGVCAVSMENLDLCLSDDEYLIPDIMLICDRQRIKRWESPDRPISNEWLTKFFMAQ